MLPFVVEWQKRNTLAITGFFGLALMYSLRFNISIGIVAMVDETVPSNSNNTDHDNFTEDNICPALVPLNSTNSRIPLSQGHNDLFPKFKWSEKDQGLILGSFFWGYILSQVPGGLLGQRFGGKWVVSLGVLCSGILSLILPWAALNGGMTYVIIIRVLQGLSGVIPSSQLLKNYFRMHHLHKMSSICDIFSRASLFLRSPFFWQNGPHHMNEGASPHYASAGCHLEQRQQWSFQVISSPHSDGRQFSTYPEFYLLCGLLSGQC